jgi:ribosome maturation factor RimP
LVKGRVEVDAKALVRPVVEGAGFELVEVVLRREGGCRVLRVTVDADAALSLETLSELSQKIARRLDLEGFDPGSYALEVSSAGIEHSLQTAGQYRRALRERVEVKTVPPVERIEGALLAADDELLVLATSDGERLVPRTQVASARTVVDWDAELRKADR